MKDFVNLHAHYRVANLRLGVDKFPTFPKTSLPYLNWLRGEGKGEKEGGEKSKEQKAKEVGKAEFARGQREALENYLLKLIKATVSQNFRHTLYLTETDDNDLLTDVRT